MQNGRRENENRFPCFTIFGISRKVKPKCEPQRVFFFSSQNGSRKYHFLRSIITWRAEKREILIWLIPLITKINIESNDQFNESSGKNSQNKFLFQFNQDETKNHGSEDNEH